MAVPKDTSSFDEETGVIVAGFGFAGGAAAIAAADAGRQVILLEKMSVPGGISICSGGGLRVARDEAKALQYLEATNADTTPHGLLRAFAHEMTTLRARFESLARLSGAKVIATQRPANYQLPGWDTFEFVEVESVPGFDPAREYPHARSLKAGMNAFKVVHDNVRTRPSIEVRMGSPVSRLLRDATGAVTGVLVEGPQGPRRIAARHGVVLACGGFEADPAMQAQHWQLRPVLPAATRGNTGDGIRMAQALGAGTWHMWHFHGSYGFRHPDPNYVFGIRTKKLPDWTPGVHEPDVKVSWILVDQDGHRFMNEHEPYAHDTSHRPFDRYDPVRQRFPAVPAYMVFDEPGRRLYPVAKSYINDPDIPVYDWSHDNLREVDNGILQRADTIEDLARKMGVPLRALRTTLDGWNDCCADGGDEPHGRPPATRVPVRTAPFYFGPVWPVVSNTQGSLVHDVEQRVLDPFGQPIGRLYVAGELGSIWGFLYLSGGNLAECFVSGRIAGTTAAAEPARDSIPVAGSGN